MDAKQLGNFIAGRRKELGLTQSALAEKLHVTDKAVSRWERGIGLPDINSIEVLADSLEISLIELMQAQRSNTENISSQEVEQLLSDTIQLSKSSNKISRGIGGIILSVFLMISLLLVLLLISDGSIVLFSVGSIIVGLISWGIPIWQLTIAKRKRTIIATLSSYGYALLALILQFYDIAHEVQTGDFAAIEDTIRALCMVIVIFSGITTLLNIVMVKVANEENRPAA